MEFETTVPGSRDTLMFREAASAAQAMRRQMESQFDIFARIGARLRETDPAVAVTIGRGSSDHAGVYARYLIEVMQGVITSPAGLSVSSLYDVTLRAKGALCIAISQSGKSPDLVAATENFREAGAYTLALTNTENSPISKVADDTIHLCAGPEKSVAATKTYLMSLTAIAQLMAHWTQDKDLLRGLDALPDQMEAAWDLDWSAAAETFVGASSAFCLGRGMGYGGAREVALKFTETCALHAESYSVAEVMHGPAALIGPDFPLLVFAQNDATQDNIRETLDRLCGMSQRVFVAGTTHAGAVTLPTIDAHPLLQPILMIQSFYRLVNAVSMARGLNPDVPPNLSKVTETV